MIEFTRSQARALARLLEEAEPPVEAAVVADVEAWPLTDECVEVTLCSYAWVGGGATGHPLLELPAALLVDREGAVTTCHGESVAKLAWRAAGDGRMELFAVDFDGARLA